MAMNTNGRSMQAEVRLRSSGAEVGILSPPASLLLVHCLASAAMHLFRMWHSNGRCLHSQGLLEILESGGRKVRPFTRN